MPSPGTKTHARAARHATRPTRSGATARPTQRTTGPAAGRTCVCGGPTTTSTGTTRGRARANESESQAVCSPNSCGPTRRLPATDRGVRCRATTLTCGRFISTPRTPSQAPGSARPRRRETGSATASTGRRPTAALPSAAARAQGVRPKTHRVFWGAPRGRGSSRHAP